MNSLIYVFIYTMSFSGYQILLHRNTKPEMYEPVRYAAPVKVQQRPGEALHPSLSVQFYAQRIRSKSFLHNFPPKQKAPLPQC